MAWWLLLLLAVVAFALVRQVQWRRRGRPQGDPAKVEWIIVAIQAAGVVFAVVVTAVLLYGIPLILLHGWTKVFALPIGTAAAAVLAVGIKKGWIVVGDD